MDGCAPSVDDLGMVSVASRAFVFGSQRMISLAAVAKMDPSELNAPHVIDDPLGCDAHDRHRHPACSPPLETRPLGTQILTSPSTPAVNAMDSSRLCALGRTPTAVIKPLCGISHCATHVNAPPGTGVAVGSSSSSGASRRSQILSVSSTERATTAVDRCVCRR